MAISKLANMRQAKKRNSNKIERVQAAQRSDDVVGAWFNSMTWAEKARWALKVFIPELCAFSRSKILRYIASLFFGSFLLL